MNGELERLQREVVRQYGMVRQLMDERDRLRRQRDELSRQLQEAAVSRVAGRKVAVTRATGRREGGAGAGER